MREKAIKTSPTSHGRDRERALLHRALDEAAGGRSSVVLVEGGPGTGKSHLVHEAGAAAAERGFRLMSLTGLPSAASPPGEPAGDEHEQDPPWLVAVDDVHWLDTAAASALYAMILHPTGRPALWVLTRRTHEGDARVQRLFAVLQERGAAVLRLGPLPDDAVRALLHEHLGGPPDARLLSLAGGAAGNPQLLTDLCRGLVDEQSTVVEDGRVRLVSPRLPARVRDRAKQELHLVSPPTRHLLRVTAVLGGSFSHDDVVAMTGQTAVDLYACVQEAMDAGLLDTQDDGSLRFRHELIRQALTEAVPDQILRLLHMEAGRMLLSREVRGTPPAQEPDGDRVIGLAAGGARQPVNGMAHRLGVTEALVRDAIEEPAAIYATQDRWTPGGGADPARPASPPDPAAALDRAAKLAQLCNLASPDRAGSLRRAREIVGRRAREDPAVIATALVTLASAAWDDGLVGKALELDREAVDTVGTGGSELWDIQPHMALAYKLGTLRRPDEAEPLISRCERKIAETGLSLYAAAPPILRAHVLAQSGRLSSAAAAARHGLGLAGTSGNPLFTPLAHSVLAFVCLRTGDTFTANEHVRSAQAQLAAGVISVPTTYYRWVALLSAARNGQDPVELLQGEYADFLTCPRYCQEEPAGTVWLVRSALRAGDRKLAKQVVTVVERLADRNHDVDLLRQAARHARALVDEDAEALLRVAREHRDPWSAAAAHEDLGLLRPGAPDGSATAMLEEARTRYATMGAQHDADRAAHYLRHTEFGASRPAPAGTPTVERFGLTGVERDIVELVARGMTNREIGTALFRSPHTVNFHLRRIFRKLGVRSRVELARVMSASTPPAPGGPTS